jgi:hypothetical protein
MKISEVSLTCVKLVERSVDLLEIPADSNGFIYLDYDAKTLRLRYLVAEPAGR